MYISSRFIILLFAASAFALDCGTRTCPDGNYCCNDAVMGPTCFDAGQAKCASTGVMAADGSGMTARLCGISDAACGNICFNPESYYCCNGQLLQNSQPCNSSPTGSPTSPATEAPTEAPTQAATEAPTQAPTEAPTQAPTEAPTGAPTEVPTSSPTSPVNQNNCLSYGGVSGLNCSEDEICCGAGTISPSCLPADGSKQCCTWFLSATQCDADEVCGGSYGPGASSYANCGPAETQFCNFGLGSNTFCPQNQTCCGQYGSYATCCDAEDSSTDSSTAGSTSSSSSSSSPSSSSSSSSSSSPSSSSSSSSTETATETPVLNNCPGAANTAGVNCSETETCCGANTMTPSCLPADGSKKCCVWYLSSTQCNPDEVCGGDLGYGASSSAKCGPAGSTFCQQGDAINAFCESDSPKCCGYMSQLAFCCGSNCTCPTDGTFDCKC